MSPAELDKIIQEAPEKIGELLGDLRDNINEAAVVTLSESQDSETGKATLSVSIGLKIELSASPVIWTTEAAVSVRHKVKSEPEIADTSPELMDGMGKGRKGKVTLRIGDGPELDPAAALERVRRAKKGGES